MACNIDFAHVQMGYLSHRISTPQWRIAPGTIQFIDLSYIIKGSATYYIDGIAHKVTAGDLVCIQHGTHREARHHADDPMECYSLNFQLSDLRTNEPMALPFGHVTHLGMRPHLVVLFEALYQTWLLKAPRYRLQTRGYSLLILSELFLILQHENQLANADLRVRKAVSYITEHFREPLSVQMLADLVQLNPVYFCNLFKKSMGTSVNQFIRYIRMNRAEMLLSEGNYRISEVAELCGFSNVFYFSRLFKQYKGVSPSDIAKG